MESVCDHDHGSVRVLGDEEKSMPPSTIYDYKLFDVVLVQELFKYRPQLRPNAYVNRPWNNEQDAIRQALLDGYRWVRTEGPSAVLEKQLPTPDITTLIPRHIAACAAKGVVSADTTPITARGA